MKTMIKRLSVAIIAVVIVAAVVMSVSQSKYVETVTVTPQTAELYFTEIGDVVADNMVDVYANSSGKLVKLYVAENEQINEGDIICQIDTADTENQIKQLESGIEGYRAQISNLSNSDSKDKDSLIISRNELVAQLQTLEAEKSSGNISNDERQEKQTIIIEQNEKELDNKLQDLNNAKILYDNGIMPKSDYDSALLGYENAKATLEQSKKDMILIQKGETVNSDDYYQAKKASLQVQIDGLNKMIDKNYIGSMSDYYQSLIDIDLLNIEQLQKKIVDSTVRSPISGVITKLPIKASNFVTSATPVATINSVKDNRVEVLVNTNDIDNIAVNRQVELILRRRDADKTLTGVVTEIDHTAVIKTSNKGNEERMVKVKVKPDLIEEFKVGYDVDVKFIYYREENKLVVPKSAVVSENGNNFVWLVDGGKLVAAPVGVGKTLRSDTVIENGIAEGGIVVIDGSDASLKKGMKVKITP